MRRALHVILGSSSPRRRELLAAAGVAFEIVTPDIEEVPRRGESPEAFARRAAREKAEAVTSRLPPRRPAAPLRVVIGCDTVVALGPRILGKPRDAADARRMLRALSGRVHRVLSSVCVMHETPAGGWRRAQRTPATTVAFRRLTADEIARYVAGGEPMDKAGAYAIQGGAAAFVRHVHGCYTNVIGFPLEDALALLARPSARPGFKKESTS